MEGVEIVLESEVEKTIPLQWARDHLKTGPYFSEFEDEWGLGTATMPRAYP